MGLSFHKISLNFNDTILMLEFRNELICRTEMSIIQPAIVF